jgi:hypothetical protein
MGMKSICLMMKTTCRLTLLLKEIWREVWLPPVNLKKYTAKRAAALNHVNLFVA